MNSFSIQIKIKKPFSFERTVKKPAGWHWATPFELFENNVLYTAVRLTNNSLVGLKLSKDNGFVIAKVFSDGIDQAEKDELYELVKLGLGADEDLTGFYHLAKKDGLVKRLKNDLYGMRLGFPTGVFERTLLAITLQMAPTKRSYQMMNCLIKRYGDRIKVDGREILYWPASNAISQLKTEKIAKDCNLGYRSKYIKKVAHSIESGFPTILELQKLSKENVQKELEKLPGIGSYSAQIISPYFGFPLDVWSACIFHEILCDKTPEHPREVIEKLEKKADKRWGNYKHYVFVYVLHDLQNLEQHYSITKIA